MAYANLIEYDWDSSRVNGYLMHFGVRRLPGYLVYLNFSFRLTNTYDRIIYSYRVFGSWKDQT